MSREDESASALRMNRRQFLRRSGSTAVGVGALGVASSPVFAAPDEARVRRYKKLGRTGLEISDISFGVAGLEEADAIRFAYDRGINYFDCAEMYQKGEAERKLGRGIRGIRDKVYITSKVITRASWKRDRMMRKLEGSLKRLQTDYIDVFFCHAVNDVARLQSPEWSEFIALAKKQGKIRFSGMSGHGGYLKDCIDYAVDNELVDVILAAHNFGADPRFYESFTRAFDFVANQEGLPKHLKRAHEKGIGVIVMKTLMGARLNDMRPYEWGGATFAQAAFRWVLQNPDIDALIVSMKNKKNVAEYLGASGQSGTRAADRRLLEGYLLANGESYCRNACRLCEGSCPEGVSIPDVLRARMYAKDYRDPEMAATSYGRAAVDASACADCEHQACAGSCPFGLDTPRLVAEAGRLLGG
jgi:predicted aldo/keto reductase-like oxidoreductase